MIDVFISHSHRDTEKAQLIAECLRPQFAVWVDQVLIGGQEFSPAIFAAIGKTTVTLVLVSQESAGSEWVRKESLAALETTAIIPIRLDDTPLPDHLQHLHALDFSNWAPGEEPPAGALDTLKRDVALWVEKARPKDEERTATALLGVVFLGKSGERSS